MCNVSLTPITVSKDDRQEESDRHRASQEGSCPLADLSNTNRSSFDAPEMPKLLRYEDEAIPEMPSLQSLLGSSLAFVSNHILIFNHSNCIIP